MCVAERDEATTEASDHNATSFTEVDKRVKRRLLMGNSYAPTFIHSCVLRDGVLSCQEPLGDVKQRRELMSSKPMHSSVFWANCEMTTRSPSRPQFSPLKNMHLWQCGTFHVFPPFGKSKVWIFSCIVSIYQWCDSRFSSLDACKTLYLWPFTKYVTSTGDLGSLVMDNTCC